MSHETFQTEAFQRKSLRAVPAAGHAAAGGRASDPGTGAAGPGRPDAPGAGAAGGLGYAFLAYLNAKLQSGIDTVLDIAGFDEIIKDADIVITGEGKSDVQTLMGKAPYGVQKRCISAGVVTWLLSGAIDDPECVLSRHFANVRSINENDTRPLAQLLLPEVAKYNLKQTVKKIISGRE